MVTEELKKVYNALNQIEIKGEDNVACMFVALSTLNKLLEKLTVSQEEQK